MLLEKCLEFSRLCSKQPILIRYYGMHADFSASLKAIEPRRAHAIEFEDFAVDCNLPEHVHRKKVNGGCFGHLQRSLIQRAIEKSILSKLNEICAMCALGSITEPEHDVVAPVDYFVRSAFVIVFRKGDCAVLELSFTVLIAIGCSPRAEKRLVKNRLPVFIEWLQRG